MSRSDKALVAIVLSLSVVGVAALAVDQTSRPLVQPNAAYNPYPVTNWRVAFNSSTADSSTSSVSPFADADWSTTGYEITTAGGRIAMNRAGAERFEVLCLFTTAGASCTLQPFGFDYVLTTDVTTSSTASLRAPGSAGVNLGVPYNLAEDDSADTLTFTATSMAWKASISSSGGFIHADETGGTTYYVSPIQTFDLRGFMAFWPRVTSISAGTVVVLVRVI